MDFKLPQWEIAKELADKLPGPKSTDKNTEKCDNCGEPIEQKTKKG